MNYELCEVFYAVAKVCIQQVKVYMFKSRQGYHFFFVLAVNKAIVLNKNHSFTSLIILMGYSQSDHKRNPRMKKKKKQCTVSIF